MKKVTTIDNAIDAFSNYKMFSIDNFKVIITPYEYYNYLLYNLEKANVVCMACLIFEIEEKGMILLEMLLNRMRNNKYTIVLLDKSRNARNKILIDYINNNNMWKVFKMVDVNNYKILPNIINQILGVYHLKAYLFDNEVCISGANMAETYFTNRIDRYFVIKDKKLANFVYDDMFRKYCNKSNLFNIFNDKDRIRILEQIKNKNTIIKQKSRQIKNEEKSENTIDAKIIKSIKSFVNTKQENHILTGKIDDNNSMDDYSYIIDDEAVEKNKNDLNNSNKYKTKIFRYFSNQENDVFKILFSIDYAELYISTAYLNFPKNHINLMKDREFNLFVPSPFANTFYNFKTFGKIITAIYSYSSYITVKCLKKCNLYEYSRKDYTFHAKGVWHIGPDFWITIIGSSNYNQRSVKIDDECSWIILSNNPEIKTRFNNELTNLKKYSVLKKKEELAIRKYSFIVKLLYICFNILF